MHKINDVVVVILPGSQIIGRCYKLERGKVCLSLPFELSVNPDGSLGMLPLGILFKVQNPYLTIEDYKYLDVGVARDTLAKLYEEREAELKPFLPPMIETKELAKELINCKVSQFKSKPTSTDPKNPEKCKIIQFRKQH